MDLEPTDDQQLYYETTVRFIESELPVARTRELHEDPRGYDWRETSPATITTRPCSC